MKLNQLAELRITKALAEGDVTDFYDFLALLNAETRMNGGNHTRANTEDVLIATRGAGLERKHAGIKQVVYSPLGAHSEKPWEVRHRLGCYTATYRGLSCSVAAQRQAGATGETNAPPLQLS